MTTKNERVVKCVPGGTLKKARTESEPFVRVEHRGLDEYVHIANTGYMITVPGKVARPVPRFNFMAFFKRVINSGLVPLVYISDAFKTSPVVGRALRDHNKHILEQMYHKNLQTIRRCQQENRFLREIWWQVDGTDCFERINKDNY